MGSTSFVKVLFICVASALVTTGLSFKAYQHWYFNEVKIRSSKEFLISGIFQTGSKKEAISSNLLAEMMELSVDRPIHILDFDEKKMEKKLMSFPIFRSVKIQKKKPSKILVDYEIREPIAVCQDYQDALIDDQGVIFPYHTFFSQKNLPSVYLGISEEGDLEEKKRLFLKILKTASEMLENAHFKVTLVDVSKAFAESYSKREFIIKVEQLDSSVPFSYFLRANNIELEKPLSNFLVLSKELVKQQKLWAKLNQGKVPQPKIIDLRLDGMAFIE